MLTPNSQFPIPKRACWLHSVGSGLRLGVGDWELGVEIV
jgi:hypothetical protein